MSEWISVKDETPKACGHNDWSEMVQVFRGCNEAQYTAFFDTVTKRWSCAFSGWFIQDVTHWAKLMPPPEY